MTQRVETAHPLLNGDDNVTWDKSMSTEPSRLAQGNKYGVNPTDCIHFIPHSDVPSNTKVIYTNCVAN